ncbi:MAG: M56 family metallopeptidase [Sedimentisphaerales bacterium]|nr:M56 family metallopeptidase [Sedimentisphaerales bacterium]
MNQAINTCIKGLNNLGQGFWNYAAGIFIQTSVLIVLLLIIDFLLRKRVRALFRYCLWMLVLIKLILPASFSLPTGIGSLMGDYFPNEASIAKWIPQTEEIVPTTLNIYQRSIPLEPVVTNETAVIDIYQEYIPFEMPIMNETAAAGIEIEAISWQGLAFSGWLVGMLVLLALLIKRIKFVRGMIAQSRTANERLQRTLDECRCRIGIRQNIELRLSGNTHSPAVCGLFKPIILIPAVLLKKLSQKKLKAVLIHELAHIKRDDNWVNLLQTILQIVHFYNPFVWIANAMVHRAREQAVDEMVLVTLNPETKNYSNMLIDIAEMAFWRPKFGLRLIGVVESKKALERRINHMLNRPVPKSSKLGYLGLIAIVVIGAIILPMGRNPAEQTALAASVSDGRIADNIIVPGVRVGKFTFGISEDDVLESMGKPRVIFYGSEQYTLDNLPRHYYMVFDDVSFRIHNDSVKEITTISPYYKFANGLGVGNSEQKIKEVFGDDFNIKETEWKDFLTYEDKGLVFEIDKRDRTIMEINVSPLPGSESYKKANIPPTSYINDKGRLVDKVDYPFVNDPKVVGGWKTVDFVREIEQFNPNKKIWRGELWLNHIIFEEGGTMLRSGQTWTKGLVLDDDTASKYIIREIDGSAYMFYEWKSGDYTIRYMKPFYYVLKKVLTESLKYEPKYGKKANIPPTSTINEQGRIVDKIDWPFVNDPQLIGTWKSVDFVGEMEEFKAGEKKWEGRGGDLYLKGLIFKPNGRTFKPWWTWTKGLVFHSGDKTASKYTLKNIEGSTYMFYEWKSGDYTIRHSKPSYYVLKKVSSKTSGPLDKVWISKQEDDEDEIMGDDKAHIPPTSTINEKGHIVDKIDWPFVNDSQVLGTWKSIDFVDKMEQFKVGEQQWKGRGGELFLNEMIFGNNGRLISKNDKVPRGYPGTWTKGLVIYDNDTKTASKYIIKELDGSVYMFYEWKSGDYTFRHSKPSYYVLKKVSSETSGLTDARVAQRKGLLGLELNDERWPHVDIVPGMPAAKAGLQNGDKILKVNDKDITHITTISGALEVLQGKPGEQVILTIQRGGQILTFLVERSK